MGRRRGRDRHWRALLAALLVAVVVVATGAVTQLRHHDRAAAAGAVPAGQVVSRHRHEGGPEGWLRRISAALPRGARPGHGHPTPRVLSPAQELHDVGPLPPGWGRSVHDLEIGGIERNYLVVAPLRPVTRADQLPLYVVLHGRGSNPAAMERLTSLAAVTGPAVLVYPAGYEDSWNAGGCCGYAHADGINDVAFIHAVVQGVLAEYPAVDPQRAFAFGFSNGGRMTYRLACDLPGTFAGIAAVEAVPVVDCRRLHPLDVEIIAQRRDPLLAIASGAPRKSMDGYVEPTVQSAVDQWRRLDGCAPPATTSHRGTATLRTWRCRAGTRLQYTLYSGGGHLWPHAHGTRPAADGIILPFVRSAPRPAD
jgi:polyhydroxybutyrate depolymerase